jgi:pyruvate kinase
LLDNAVKLSHEINAGLIILFTDQIQFAKILTNLRPPCIIACPTSSIKSYRFLRLFRGVIPYLHEESIFSIDDLLKKLIEKFRGKNIICKYVKSILIRANVNKKNLDKNNEKDNYNNGIFCYDF